MTAPATQDQTTLARKTLQGLLNGEAPNGIPPEICGPWGEIIHIAYTAHARGGNPAVRQVIDASAKANRGLAQLLAGDEFRNTNPPDTMPALPDHTQSIYQELAPCGAWLDTYVSYALQAAPMTPKVFHETAGLIAASTAIAGRLCLPLAARPLYPNLYALFLSPSTIAHKSTGFGVLEQTLQSAGIHHLLMPHKAPPEAFVADLDPQKLPGKRIQNMDFFLARRAFAAQRCYLRDEVSALFSGLKREFNAGLLELLLGIYDVQPRYEESTISRGDVVIEHGYLTFFGASTPIEMAPHLASTSNWTNGLWARFALISVDQPGTFVFFPQHVTGMQTVAAGLKALYTLFPVPEAEYAEYAEDDGLKERRIVVTGVMPPSNVILANGVWDFWRTYSETMHEFLCHGDLDEALNANYGRFGAQAMKLAMLLAAMDTTELPVKVELRHYARAQTIAETWRESLHRIWTHQGMTAETRLMLRIQTKLERAGMQGVTARILCKSLKAKIKDVDEVLALMHKAGQIIKHDTIGQNGRHMEVWQWAE